MVGIQEKGRILDRSVTRLNIDHQGDPGKQIMFVNILALMKQNAYYLQELNKMI